MATDPYKALFVASPFAGSGVIADYFPAPPDLSYLRGRPEFIGQSGSYNPDLDAPALVEQGVPEEVALQIQDYRRSLHGISQQRALQKEAQQALAALSQVDPSRETFSKDFLKIMQRYPNAAAMPEFTERAKLIADFSQSMPLQKKEIEKTFDPDSIEDPDLYQQAIAEKWDTLPEKAGQRRLFDAKARKERRLELVKAGLPIEEIDAMEQQGPLSEERLVSALAKAKQQAPAVSRPESARYIADLMQKSLEARQQMLSPEGKLAWLQQKYGDPNRTTFSKADWDEANAAMTQTPTPYDLQIQTYQNLLGGQPMAPVAPSAAPQAPVIRTKAEYDALPAGSRYIDSKGQVAIKKK